MTTPVARDRPLRLVMVGVGAIGAVAYAEARRQSRFAVTGVVDPARSGEVVDCLEISDRVNPGAGDVAVVAAGSSLGASVDLLESLLDAGYHVVSTCEELAFPWRQHAAAATRLDAAAKRNGLAVIGCGVNPGFVMDVLPSVLATCVVEPQKVAVARSVDLGQRRPQLREKMGVGEAPDDWASGSYGHVGLLESAELCAHGVGWAIAESSFERAPIVSDGTVVGVREEARVVADGEERVSLELVFALGGEDRDSVRVTGRPSIVAEINGGVAGDLATVARMLASAQAAPGLTSGLHLPLGVPVN